MIVGFCGHSPLFQPLYWKPANLIRDGETIKLLINVLVSVIIGFIIFKIGVLIGEVI